jgi:5-formaminoimidazole-4-carboxamide-1-(beta)-D-ribofuranosyl 5'-monophosphate synthetase
LTSLIVKDFTELLNEKLQERLRNLNVVLIPHGSFTAYLSTEQLTDNLNVPMMGNRQLLHWEANRKSQEEWLRQAGSDCQPHSNRQTTSTALSSPKLQGAKGGRGYFLANSPEASTRKQTK